MRGGKCLVRSETHLRIVDTVQRATFFVRAVVQSKELVGRASLGGNTPKIADQTAQRDRRHKLAVRRASGRGNAFVDQGAAEIIGPGGQQVLSEFRARDRKSTRLNSS